jgi:hypothetical protein
VLTGILPFSVLIAGALIAMPEILQRSNKKRSLELISMKHLPDTKLL